MKPFRWIVVFLFLTHSHYVLAECENTLIVGWTNWKPYQYMGPKGEVKGLDVDLLKAVFQDQKCEITFEDAPWARLIYWLERGVIDMLPGASKTKKRETFSYFSDAYRVETVALYVRKDETFPIKKLEDIMNLPFLLGVERDAFYGKEYAALTENPAFKKNLEISNDNDSIYRKLVAKRIDGFLGQTVSTEKNLATLSILDKIERHPMPLINTGNIHVMFSKKKTPKSIVTMFNNGIAKLKANGTYDAIKRKYTSKTE